MSARRDIEADVLVRFMKDTTGHQLEVVKDDGLHRHLRFRRPGTYVYGFDVVTWPGHLAISGDMGAAMFSRLPDMFEFFRERTDPDSPAKLHINSGYWAEKCTANDGAMKKFNNDLFEREVRDHFDSFMQAHSEFEGFEEARDALWDEIGEEVLGHYDSTHEALVACMDFEPSEDRFPGFSMHDAWEWASSVESYTFHFLWRLYAIAYAVKAYDALKAEVQA